MRILGKTMKPRHIETSKQYSSAAIDDIIERGRLADWHELREAADKDSVIIDKILRICKARCVDPYAQRYHLWRLYAEQHRSS